MMVRSRKLIGLALLFGGLLMGLSPESPAATSSTLDVLSADRAGETPDTVDIGPLTPIARPNREGARPLPGGNPLWGIPLSALSQTQQRPIFSASRRPPPRAVVAPVEQAAAAPPPKPPEADRPALALIGAVVGESDAIAVFLDQTNQQIIRLRQGESHAGWELGLVQPREVTLKKADRIEVLVLKRQDGLGSEAGAVGAPGLVVPAATGGATFYAPFVPRATPKNGESDGL